MKWENYIQIIHESISQTNVSCLDNNTIKIESMIVSDINDPKSVYVLLPNSDLMGLSVAPSLANWNTLLVKIGANYQSQNQPVLYTRNECNNK